GRESGEDAAGVEPPDARAEDRVPIEAARPEEGGSLVRAVIEHDGSADSLASVAPDLRDVGAAHAVVPEAGVIGLDARLAHDALDLEGDGQIVHHGAGDGRPHAEAAGEVGRDVVFAAGDMKLVMGGAREGNYSWIEPRDEGAEGEEIMLLPLGGRYPERRHAVPPSGRVCRGARRAASARPVRTEESAAGGVEALVGMGAEVVALGLEEI